MGLQLIDSHFHLWKHDTLLVPGSLSLPPLNRDINWEDYAAATDGVDIAASVMVQVDHAPVDGEPEVEWIETVAAEHPTLKAVVAWAPLETEARKEHLDRLVRHAIVRGIRRNTQHEPDPGFCAQPEFIAGAAVLADYGLPCDLCVLAEQLEAVVALARACPQTTFVLNHIGKPDIRNHVTEPWRTHMAALADLGNVHCKLSPVARGENSPWSKEAIAGYVETVIGLFGSDRILWASNWPVSLLATEYRAWVDLAMDLTSGLGSEGQKAVFHDNAAGIYRIG